MAGLIFIAYPVVRIILRPPDPVVAALALAATAIFAVMIWSVARRDPDDDRRRSLVLAALDVVLLVIVAVLVLIAPDQGWVALFYYASSAASLILPERRAIALIVLAGVVAAVSIAPTDEIASALIQGLSVSIIGITIFAMAALRRMNAKLYAAREELAALAVAAERDRIARDLHDVLGHSLSVIAIKSELAGRLLPADPERARAEIADVERVARESLAAVRETVSGVRQPTLERELENARVVLESAGIRAAIEDRAGPISAADDAVLAWAVREAVTNVVRHSAAREAAIRTSRDRDEASVEVIDDGAAAPLAAPEPDPDGTGLRGLRERLAVVGGRLEAGPGPAGGYRLKATLPVHGVTRPVSPIATTEPAQARPAPSRAAQAPSPATQAPSPAVPPSVAPPRP